MSPYENASIAILDVGRMNDSVEQKTYCVDKNVPLLALDLLARIVAVRINARPPYMGRLKSSANSCLRRFNFALNPGGFDFALTARGRAQSIGSHSLVRPAPRAFFRPDR